MSKTQAEKLLFKNPVVYIQTTKSQYPKAFPADVQETRDKIQKILSRVRQRRQVKETIGR